MKQGLLKKMGGNVPATLRMHAVELVMLLYAAVVVFLVLQDGLQLPECMTTHSHWILFPLALVLAYCTGHWCRRAGLPQWFVLIPASILAFSYLLPAAEVSDTVWAIVGVAAPLILLLTYRLRSDNADFAEDGCHMVRSGVLSGIGSMMLFVATMAIYFSFEYIFGLGSLSEKGVPFRVISIVCFMLVLPLLFCLLEDGRSVGEGPGHFEVRLFKWVLTPALLIYTLILYIYGIQILVRWDLPKGSVAAMVFAYSIVAVCCAMYHIGYKDMPFKRFYRYIGALVLPTILLFWVGSIRRISDYGCTEGRYYLVVCGLVMTAFVVALALRLRRGLFTVSVASLALFLITLLPPVSAERVSFRSHLGIVRHNADALGILTPDGQLAAFEASPSDTADCEAHRRIYQSLLYLSSRDKAGMTESLGIDSPRTYLGRLTQETQKFAASFNEDATFRAPERYWECSLLLPAGGFVADEIGGRLVVAEKSVAEGQPVSLGDLTVDINAHLESVLAKHGMVNGNGVDARWLKDHADEILVCRTADGVLVLAEASVYRERESGRIELSNCRIMAAIAY